MNIPAIVGPLQRHDLRYAVVGAVAVIARGHARYTVDLDLLTTDRRVLSPEPWASLQEQGAHVEIRMGDDDDPLAGVVRIELTDGTRADVIVGRSRWQQDIIERAEPLDLAGTVVPVVRIADLILLKLFAGGPIDVADIHALLDTGDSAAIRQEVSGIIEPLPEDARSLWATILQNRR